MADSKNSGKPLTVNDVLEAENDVSKDDLRSGRMRRANGLNEKIWNAWQKHCFSECELYVKKYWVCRQEEGFNAIIACREDNEKMKNCLQTWGKDEDKFRDFKIDYLEKLHDRIRQSREEAAKVQ